MNFGMVIIGDEILLGKRVDRHFSFVQQALKIRGLELAWCRIVGDEAAFLTQTFCETLASGDVVFSFGGIGATPDDRTRQCAAAAMQVPLSLHPQGLALMQEKFADLLNQRRKRLIDFPQGASLIPNPINQVPGFSLRQHHFVPGFPNMAQPMIEWVLDEYYADEFKSEPGIEKLIRVLNTPESDLIPIMDEVIASHAAVKLCSLPNTRHRGVVELGVRGMAADVDLANEQLVALLKQQNIRFSCLN